MSFIEVSEIEFTSKKSCFISIPKKWINKTNDKISIFRIKSLREEESEEVVMSWSGDTTQSDNTIQVNGLFANKLGFSHKQQVLVTYVPNPSANGITNAFKCYLKPISDNDWQILSMNSAFIETNLLNQIRVLALGQIFPVWITNQSNVCLFVECFHLTPIQSKAVILNNLTEVIVCPPKTVRNTIDGSDDNDLQPTDRLSTDSQSIASNDLNYNSSQSMVSSMFGFVKSFITNTPPEESKQMPSINSNECLKSSDCIEIETGIDFNEVLRVLPFFDDKDEDKDAINTVFVSNQVFNNCENNYFISKLIHILSPNERKREHQKNERQSDTNSASKDALSVSQHISQMDFKETSKVLNDLLKNDLIRLIDKTSSKMLCLINGSLIHLCETDFFTYHKNGTSAYVITLMSVKQLSITICEPVMALQKPFCKRIETIQKSWNQCMAECLHRQPSVLVFEDLDAIASMPSKPGQETSAEALHSERIGLLFMDLIEKINRNEISYGNRVAVIATSKTNKTLQTVLVQSRGKHL
ncbi:unnamed protein product, partial [Medioppia subpectinata]